MTIPSIRGCVPGLVAVLLAIPHTSIAEDLTIWSQPLGAFVELGGATRLEGITPLPLDNRMNGPYRMRVTRRGYEESRGRVILRSRDGRLSLLGPPSGFRTERMTRSLLLPGSGQFMAGRRTAGFIWGTTSVGALIWAISASNSYVDARDSFTQANNQFQQIAASEGFLDFAVLDRVLSLEVESRRRKNERDVAWLTTAALWTGNLIDAAFFHRKVELREGSDGVLVIPMTEKTRKRAVLRSVLFPGLGQDYSGYSYKGFLYAMAFAGAGAMTIVRALDTEEQSDLIKTLDFELSLLSAPQNEDEATLRDVVRLRRAFAEDQFTRFEDSRNNWAIATASIYLASLIDAAILRPRGTIPDFESAELSFLSVPSTGEPAVGLRYEF